MISNPADSHERRAAAAAIKNNTEQIAIPARNSPNRLDWLFRDSLRRHEVHPLLQIMRRHRSLEQP